MKKQMIVVGAVVVAILAFLGVREYVIKPAEEKARVEYEEEQKRAATHDIEALLKYKEDSIGDGSNVINFNYYLPLGEYERTYEINSENEAVTINYLVSSSLVEEKELKADIIYNATANFALIGNLKNIAFTFTDGKYIISREALESFYASSTEELLEEDNWKKVVQNSLEDEEYLNTAISKITE